MKFGVRKPNFKKSVKARTTGKIKRKIKSSTNPLYGKKGTGMIKNPKKSLYNKVYRQTTIGVNPLSKTSSRKSTRSFSTVNNRKNAIGYTKKEVIEKEIIITNPIEKWFRKLLGKNNINRKVIEETVTTEQYTYQEIEEIKLAAEENINRYEQSLRYTNETVNIGVFFSNLSDAEESLSQATSMIRRYSFLVTEDSNIIEVYHQFLSQKEAIIKQFLHRHFKNCIESANELKTERGKRNRLTKNYSELTEQFHLLSEEAIETANTIWNHVINENVLKES